MFVYIWGSYKAGVDFCVFRVIIVETGFYFRKAWLWINTKDVTVSSIGGVNGGSGVDWRAVGLLSIEHVNDVGKHSTV